MAEKNDPRLIDMIRAWIRYAKGIGIATTQQDGRAPDTSDVLKFLTAYVPTQLLQYPKTANRILARAKKSLATINLDSKSQPKVGSDELNRIKAIIRNKFSAAQRKQLKRELQRAKS